MARFFLRRNKLLPVARPLAVIILLTLTLGLGFGTTPHHTSIAVTSSCLGWAYFSCWSISFYPQVVQNFERRSVVGFSFDFALLNLVGFACYSAFNLALFYSPEVREEYEKHNGGHGSAVRVNDVFFGLHAVALSAVQLSQIWCYPRGNQKFSRWVKLFCLLVCIGTPVGVILAAVRLHGCKWCNWLTLLYALAYVKLGITLVKYIPQVYINWRNRSTDGWSIDNCVLDFGGGLLSVAQLLLDAYSSHDWGKVTGDPVKFGLGFTSMVFDTIFMLQHWVCYRKRGTGRGRLGGLLGRSSGGAAPLLLSVNAEAPAA